LKVYERKKLWVKLTSDRENGGCLKGETGGLGEFGDEILIFGSLTGNDRHETRRDQNSKCAQLD